MWHTSRQFPLASLLSQIRWSVSGRCRKLDCWNSLLKKPETTHLHHFQVPASVARKNLPGKSNEVALLTCKPPWRQIFFLASQSFANLSNNLQSRQYALQRSYTAYSDLLTTIGPVIDSWNNYLKHRAESFS